MEGDGPDPKQRDHDLGPQMGIPEAAPENIDEGAEIAIGKVRLFKELQARDRELTEAIDQQIATAEILRVISRSPDDSQPVFDAIVRSGLTLFAGAAVSIALPDGQLIHVAAVAESDPDRAQAWSDRFPFPLTREYMHGVAILDCRIVDVPDVRNAPQEWAPGIRDFLASGYLAVTIVPMIRGDTAIGALSVVRREPGPLTARQHAALRTFTEQALIAIENVRLFNETRDALERQTATADILRVISSSPTSTAPVFEAILESSARLCDADMGLVLRYEDGTFQTIATLVPDPAFDAFLYQPIKAGPLTGLGRIALTKAPVHVADLVQDEAYRIRDPLRVRSVELGGIRTWLGVPMLREDELIGTIVIYRKEVRPFEPRQVDVLRTFADQAVIAIENVRLFNELREKSVQLELASRHKSQFLANMSHELRTPLNAIIGFTRIVMRRSQQQLEQKQFENLQKILQSGENLLALINSILDLAKVEAGHVAVNPRDAQLLPLLEQCLRTVEPLVKDDSVKLVREFDCGLPSVYVDDEKLRQIVINLLSNAAKFTTNGSISLRATAVDGRIDIAVADTGSGIPADKLELIFDEFEQADASSTRVHGGTGLGLTIARRLARLMGGDIAAESAPGIGSTFTLSLPLRYADAPG